MVRIHSPVTLNKRQKALVESFIERPFPPKAWAREEDLADLWAIAQDLGRDMALFIDRRGRVQGVRIESRRDRSFFSPPNKGQRKGLLGWRLLATDLHGKAGEETAELEALHHWHYDSLGVVYGTPESPRLRTALLQAGEEGLMEVPSHHQDLDLSLGADRSMGQAIQDLEKALEASLQVSDFGRERAVLVFLPQEGEELQVLEDELTALAETAGVEVVGSIHQPSRSAHKRLGAGKIQEVAELIRAQEANVVLFNDLLSPAQHRDMDKALGVKVLDKTALILDIFALRATSREGKLQVELAQLDYLLPRLTGKGQELSRLGGGVGTRGPGETQLETDRRHIRQRMTKLRQELDEVGQDRAIQRRARDQSGRMTFALVGYTNAGKSSLLNALSGSDLFAEDQLFATLDAATRIVRLDSGEEILISDTVGFIRDLPPELLDAFKSTLEELHYVDVLLHVVDASAPDLEERIEIVEETLKSLELEGKKTLTIFNKLDAVEEMPVLGRSLVREDAIAVSAQTGQGLEELKSMLEGILQERERQALIHLPFNDAESGRLRAQIHNHGRILEEKHDAEGTRLLIAMPREDGLWVALTPYIVFE